MARIRPAARRVGRRFCFHSQTPPAAPGTVPRTAHSPANPGGRKRTALMLLVLPCLCSLGHAARALLGGSSSAQHHELRPRLLMVQSTTQLDALLALCGTGQLEAGVLPEAHGSMHATCAQGVLTGPRIDHVYQHTVKGVAGLFSEAHIMGLKACLGQDILHVEDDGRVSKAEGGPDEPPPTLPGPTLTSQLDTHAPHTPQPTAYVGTPANPSSSGSNATPPGMPNRSNTARRSDLETLAAATLLHAQQSHRGDLNGPGITAPRVTADGGPDSVPPERQSLLLQMLGWGARVRMDMEALMGRAVGVSSPTDAGSAAARPPRPTTVQAFGRDASGATAAPSPPVSFPRPPDGNAPSTSAPPGVANAAPGAAQPQPADVLAALSDVQDRAVPKVERLPPALWNLDRIDQQLPPLDRQYVYGSAANPGSGAGVTVYALDSGVVASHQEFQRVGNGGGSRASYGYDFVRNAAGASDCDGHGTHVAATAIGRSVGVAKSASLVAVRVLDCTGSGSISDTIAGIDWVATNAKKPAVAIMSLGVTDGVWSKTLEAAARSLVTDHGVTVVVAAGNSAVDACGVVPANMPETITVAASNMENKFDAVNPGGKETMYRWSNTGSCVDLWAPGVEIWSACGGASRCPAVADDAYTWASGTSMAVPHVVGLAAIVLSKNPGARPAEVASAMRSATTSGRLDDPRILPGTPNLMLWTRAPVITGGSVVAPAVEAQASARTP